MRSIAMQAATRSIHSEQPNAAHESVAVNLGNSQRSRPVTAFDFHHVWQLPGHAGDDIITGNEADSVVEAGSTRQARRWISLGWKTAR
jgi:hypothetical protein